jgi:hypothetical protein
MRQRATWHFVLRQRATWHFVLRQRATWHSVLRQTATWHFVKELRDILFWDKELRDILFWDRHTWHFVLRQRATWHFVLRQRGKWQVPACKSYIGKCWIFIVRIWLCSKAVGWGIVSQTRRSRVRLPMQSLEIFIDLIIPAAMSLWYQARPWAQRCPVRGAENPPSPHSSTDCQKSSEPQRSETLRAYLDLYIDRLTCFYR